MNDAFQSVVDALAAHGCKPTPSGDGYRAYCPAHEADERSHTPSLSIAQGARQNVVLKCHAGCDYGAIVLALGLDGKPEKTKRRIVATYAYCDAAGKEVRQKVRYEPKGFAIRHQVAGEWVYKAGPGHAVLYRLPELDRSGDVYVCEGEKDVDRLCSLGFVATCNIEGAAQPNQKAKWRREYTEQLAGAARVVLVPDNDAPGRAHMAAIAQALRGKVTDLRWLELPGLPEKGDVSDWLNAGHTADELRALVEQAPAPNHRVEAYDPATLADEALELIRGTDIRPKPIKWLWPGWLAAGKLHVIAGPTGVGKTTVVLSMAATLTRGGCWPSGEQTDPTNVVIWSGEDDPEDTLAGRLIASGADMSRVFFVRRVLTRGERRAFDPATDMDLLLTRIQRTGNVGMAMIDPLVSAVAGDSHKNGEVRRALQPLVDLAQLTKTAVVGISHFAKSSNGRDPVERVVGSLAFGALARIVMAATKVSEEQGGGRMLIRTKSNIGRDNDGYRYAIQLCELPDYPGVETSYCEWGEAITGDAQTLLNSAEATTDPEERSEREEAKEFLQTVLADGPVPAKQVKREADENGYTWITIRRAQKALCIVSEKSGMKGEWRWSLPRRCSSRPEDAHVAQSGKSEHLRDR